MRKYSWLLLSFLVVGVILQIFWIRPAHPYFFWHKIPGFYALLGLAGSVVLMSAAKYLGKFWLSRPENYYKDES